MVRFKLLCAVTVLCISCSRPQKEHDGIIRIQNEHQQTSTALANLPAVYKGSVGCDFCDSVNLEFTLSTDLQYTLDKRWRGKKTGITDSAHTESGEWLISNSNTIELRSSTGNSEYTKFRIITDDELQLLDSTGSVITDGKNYMLSRKMQNS